MNRRQSIRQFALGTVGLVTLPAWASEWEPGELSVSSYLTGTETLASVADTIIPNNGTIGALSVGVDKFLQKLIQDCYDVEVNSNVETQLKQLNAWAEATHGKSFAACGQTQREELLRKMAASAEKPQVDFFKLVKSETIRGFNTSREVMVNYLKYKLVPGHYHGCVDVNT